MVLRRWIGAFAVLAAFGAAAARGAEDPLLIPPAPGESTYQEPSDGEPSRDAVGGEAGPQLFSLPPLPARSEAASGVGRGESLKARPAGDQDLGPRPGSSKDHPNSPPPSPALSDAPPVEQREPTQLDSEVQSRYRRIGDEWWFQLRSGAWKYYRGGEWRDFDPATYVPLGARARLDEPPLGPQPYVTHRPVEPFQGEFDPQPRSPAVNLPPGYRLLPADAVDLRTGTYYGPGPGEVAHPVEDDQVGRQRRNGPVRSFVRGVVGRLRP